MKPLRVFIVQPFKVPYAAKFRELVTQVCQETDPGSFEAFHALDEPSREQRLLDRINEYVRHADICVADLSGTRNENALLEVGAAYTLRIPVIPFADKALPTDLQGLLYVHMDSSALGNADAERTLKSDFARKLKEAQGHISTVHTERYIAGAFRDRGAIDVYSLVRRSERRLDVLTTNLNYIVNERLACGDAGPQTFLEILRNELKHKPPRFEVRILAMDPDSNYTNERALSLHRNRQAFREQMRDDLEKVKAYIESQECGVNAEIHIYDDYPLQMTFFFDDIVISSVVAGSRSSRYCVTYMHSLKESGAQETYERHFDQLWGKSIPYAVSRQMTRRTRSEPRAT